ncbi:hypothetical protein LTR53_005260 [Teratosphaeriaceae sp. CCFEE 6253]|nr:hypothetical protein LTR53_005260 [Teratosphaeriaceae sp. CCFEE 6253]
MTASPGHLSQLPSGGFGSESLAMEDFLHLPRRHNADLRTSSLRNERLIKIVIGDGDHEPYHIQQTILESASDYFKKALAHESQLGSDEPGTLTFPEDNLGAWEALLYWLLKHDLPPPMQVPCESHIVPVGEHELLLVRCWAMGEKYGLSVFQDLVMTTMLKWVESCGSFEYATLEEAFQSTPPGCALRLLTADDLAFRIVDSQEGLPLVRDVIEFLEGIPGCMGEVLSAVSDFHKMSVRPTACKRPPPDWKQQECINYMVAEDHKWCMQCRCMRLRRTTRDEEE